MGITGIRIRKAMGDGKLKAYVTLTFDDSFAVHNVKIIQGREGLLVTMPSRRTKNGEYRNIAHPINAAFRAQLEDRILSEYERMGDAMEHTVE